MPAQTAVGAGQVPAPARAVDKLGNDDSKTSVLPPANVPSSPKTPGPVGNFLSSQNRIIFLSIVVVGLLIASFFLGFPSFSILKRAVGRGAADFLKTPPVNSAEIKFPSERDKKRFLEALASSIKEKDTAKKYLLDRDNFNMLVSFYSGTHDDLTRNQAILYADYIAKAYPDKYTAEKKFFTVPCYDSVCSRVNYPKEISEISKQLEETPGVDKITITNVKSSLEAAVFVSDQGSKWTNYFSAFQAVRDEYTKKKDPKVRDLAIKLRDFLKQNFSQTYSSFEKDKNISKMLEV